MTARAMKPGEDPVSHVRRLKETGISMTIIEKLLYLRATYGLGLIDARDKLKSTGNDFEGPWKDTSS